MYSAGSNSSQLGLPSCVQQWPGGHHVNSTPPFQGARPLQNGHGSDGYPNTSFPGYGAVHGSSSGIPSNPAPAIQRSEPTRPPLLKRLLPVGYGNKPRLQAVNLRSVPGIDTPASTPTSSVRGLSRHSSSASSDRPHRCDHALCGKSFDTQSGLRYSVLTLSHEPSR